MEEEDLVDECCSSPKEEQKTANKRRNDGVSEVAMNARGPQPAKKPKDSKSREVGTLGFRAAGIEKEDDKSGSKEEASNSCTLAKPAARDVPQPPSRRGHSSQNLKSKLIESLIQPKRKLSEHHEPIVEEE